MTAPNRKVKSFEDLRVFQDARSLVNRVYSLTRSGLITKDYELVSQMRRAALSVISNIAEGFERRTDAEFVHSLSIAKGSCGELRAQVLLCQDQKYFSQEAAEELISHRIRVSTALSNFIKYLKESSFEKPKHRG